MELYGILLLLKISTVYAFKINICLKNADCPIFSTCVEFVCEKDTIMKEKFCFDDRECNDIDYHCNQSTRRCERQKKSDRNFCKSEADCKSPYHCNSNNNRCEVVTNVYQIMKKSSHQKFKEKCRKTSDCGGDLFCEDNECVYEKRKKICSDDDDCGLFRVCKKGFCKDPYAETLQQKCKSNKECNSLFHCKNGDCVPKLLEELLQIEINKNNKNCQSHKDCKGISMCKNGKCEKISLQELMLITQSSQSNCMQHTDCPSDQVCLNRECEKVTSVYQLMMKSFLPDKCQVNTDCPIGKMCKQGICRKKTTREKKCIRKELGKNCSSDTDCTHQCGFKVKTKLTCVRNACRLSKDKKIRTVLSWKHFTKT